MAGAKAAEGLRERGFDGRIVLVGEEADRPYERPPLSKDLLRGERQDTPFVHPEGFYEEHGVELLSSTRAIAIDARAAEVALEGGGRLGYDRLLVCTGAEPRRLAVPGADLDGVHYLRTVEDSRRLGAELEPGRRLVVVGSGWVGSEIAASARQRGCEVTMLEMGALPLERVLGPELGHVYLELHLDNGIEYLAKTVVDRFEGEGSVERVVTGGGAVLNADLVAVGVGVVPRTELPKAAGLQIENGVAVDERLRTNDPRIFAAGDVANAHHPFYGERLRVEHWANALNQGAAAADAMLGTLDAYSEIPYFFSDQYDSGMEYSGFARDWDEVVFRGDKHAREFIAFWVRDERVVAAMNMNVWDVHDELRELIRSRAPVGRRDLEDPDASLQRLAERPPGTAAADLSAADGGSR
jgi:3-phenylpropionate/trans-cinnamate dioxygenase ferredoxin reductase subunit